MSKLDSTSSTSLTNVFQLHFVHSLLTTIEKNIQLNFLPESSIMRIILFFSFLYFHALTSLFCDQIPSSEYDSLQYLVLICKTKPIKLSQVEPTLILSILYCYYRRVHSRLIKTAGISVIYQYNQNKILISKR